MSSEQPLHAPTPALHLIREKESLVAAQRSQIVEISKYCRVELSPKAARALGRSGSGSGARTGEPYEPRGPVVVVLGWVGSQLKHLEKYAGLFRPHGYTIAYVSCPFEYLTVMSIYNFDAYLKRFKPLVDYLVGNFPALFTIKSTGDDTSLSLTDNTNKPLNSSKEDHLLFLPFSNGGCCNMFLTLESLAHFHPTLKPNVSAVICDSCPSRPHYSAFANFLAVMLFPRFAKKGWVLMITYPLAISLMVSLFLTRFVLRTLLKRRIGSENNGFPVEAAAGVHHPLLGTAPRMFIYSDKGDTMIDSDFVRSFASLTAEKIGAAYQLEFAQSEHVRHLPEHPGEYQGGVEAFMQKVVFKGEDVCGWGDDVDVEEVWGRLVVESKTLKGTDFSLARVNYEKLTAQL